MIEIILYSPVREGSTENEPGRSIVTESQLKESLLFPSLKVDSRADPEPA